MTDPELEAIRAMLRACVESQGLKEVAGQVGMSPSGLRQFLGGTNAAPHTRLKVRAWYRRYVLGDRRPRREVLVEELLADQPSNLRAGLRRGILALLSDDGGAARGAAFPGAVPAQPIVYLDFRTCAQPLPPTAEREARAWDEAGG
jgi:hypothetical protein